MARTAKIYAFSLAANASQTILAEGSFYRIQSSTSTVEVTRNTGSSLDLLAGQGEKDAEFNRLTIRDRSGAANTGLILIADNNFVDDRVIGVSDAAEINRGKSIGGSAFVATTKCAAVAAQYSRTQLNTQSSLKKSAIVSMIRIQCPTATTIQIGRESPAFGTNPATCFNKNLASAITATTGVYNQANTTSFIAAVLYELQIEANKPYIFEPSSPFVLVPSCIHPLTVFNTTLNMDLMVTYEWTEEVTA